MSTRDLTRVVALGNPPRRWIATSITLGILAVAAGIGLMATSGYLISSAALQPPILSLSVAIVGVRFFGVSRGVLRYLERLISHDAALRALVRLRVAVYRRLEPLVPGELGTVRTGDLLQRFVADVDSLQNVILRILNPVAVALGAGALAVLVAVLTLPLAGLALFAGLVFSGVVLPLTTGRLGRFAATREAPAQAIVAADLVEALRCAPELVAYGHGEQTAQALDAGSSKLAAIRRRTALVAAIGEGSMTTVTVLTTIAVIAVAIPAVSDGRLPGVYLAMLALLTLASFEAVRPLPAAVEQLGHCRTAATRIAEITDREPNIVDPASPVELGPLEQIMLSGVHFRYRPADPWVLTGADLELYPGRITALVGPSGSGKSTIAQLLLRFRDPTGGTIAVNGIDLRLLRQHDLRAAIGLAGQDAHLFPTSIRENLLIGRPAATDTDLLKALARVRALAWVTSLPAGLDTTITEDGGNISGGQRQRLALARVLLTEAQFLILDEPTAHLDRETARPLLEDLLSAARESNLGVLLISHDTIDPALVDELVSLEAGRIVP
jgi:ATP-binding cassette, subfamily C, bacterial CydC